MSYYYIFCETMKQNRNPHFFYWNWSLSPIFYISMVPCLIFPTVVSAVKQVTCYWSLLILAFPSMLAEMRYRERNRGPQRAHLHYQFEYQIHLRETALDISVLTRQYNRSIKSDDEMINSGNSVEAGSHDNEVALIEAIVLYDEIALELPKSLSF